MKIWNVVWKLPTSSVSAMLPQYPSQSKTQSFGSKAKAEEFYKKIYEASLLIGVHIDAHINESDLEE